MTGTEPIAQNEYGDDVHPAFGMISASRISVAGGPQNGSVLFDSDIVHQHTVRVTIKGASRKRDLHHDWVHEGPQIVELELSEAQWASFVSSMNTQGVPATLRWTREGGRLPELEYEPRMAHSLSEVRGATRKVIADVQLAMADYEKAIEDKAGARVIKEKRAHLKAMIKNAEGNAVFAAKSLNEHAENVVQRARADIEAMVMTEANRLGLTAGQARMVELPAVPGEVVSDEQLD